METAQFYCQNLGNCANRILNPCTIHSLNELIRQYQLNAINQQNVVTVFGSSVLEKLVKVKAFRRSSVQTKKKKPRF